MYVFPVLYSERLKLRQLEVDDFPSLIKLANNRKISDRIVNVPHPYEEFNAVHRLSYVVSGFNSRQRFVFAITIKENNEFIGEISLHLYQDQSAAELGYWVGEPYWKSGFATEAIEKIIDFGFKRLNLKDIVATVDPDNPGSAKVLVKNGFEQVETRGKTMIFMISTVNI